MGLGGVEPPSDPRQRSVVPLDHRPIQQIREDACFKDYGHHNLSFIS